MRINVAIPEAQVQKPVLDAALESVTRLNESLISNGKIPTFEEAREKYGIRWKPEPPGDEHFDHGQTVIKRRWGDCDDLAPFHAASLRVTGEDPEARAIVYKSGPKRWHAVVERGDGSIDDPSKRAGMGQPAQLIGAALPLMYTAPSAVVGGSYIVRPAIALRGFRGGAQARADMPWHWREHLSDKPKPSDYAMATLHTAPVASTALVGAIEGALELAIAGGYAHPAHVNRLAAIADAIEGIPLQEIAQCYGDEHAAAAEQALVGFSLKGLAKGVAKAATSPMGSKLIRFVPGIGPVASTALDIAHDASKGKGKGKPKPTGKGTPDSPMVPPPGPKNPFPSVESYARQGRLCIPCTFE